MEDASTEKIHLLTAILREHLALVDADEPLDVALEQLVRGACDLANTRREFGVLRIVDPVDGSLIQDIPSGFFQPGNIPEAIYGVTHQAWLTREIQNVPDVSQVPYFVRINERTRSELAVPLLIKDRCLGVLNLESEHLAHFANELEPWIQVLANQAVMTIKHLGLLDDIRRWEIAGRTGVDIEDLKTRLLVDVREALTALKGKAASVAILLEHRDELVRLAFDTNDPAGANPGTYDSLSTIAWKAFSERRVMEYQHVKQGHPQTLVSGSRAVLAWPLHNLAGEVIGVFNVEAPKPGALDGAQPLLQEAHSHAEAVLQNRDDLTQFAPEIPLSALREADQTMLPSGAQQNPGADYREALRRATQLVGGQDIQAALVLLDGENEYLTLTAERTYRYPTDGLPKTWPVRHDHTVVGECARIGSPLLADASRLAQDFRPQFPSSRSELAAPLSYPNGRMFGVLTFVSPRAGALTTTHKQLLKYLASPIVHAHEHAEAFRLGQFARERRKWSENINSQITMLLEKQDLLDIRDIYINALGELLQEGMKQTDSELGEIRVPIPVLEGLSRRDPEATFDLALIHKEPKERAVVHSGEHFPITEGITSRAYRNKRLEIVPDVSQDPDFIKALGAGMKVKSELAIPIGLEAYKLRNSKASQPENPTPELSDDQDYRTLGVFNLERSIDGYPRPEQVDWAIFLASQTAKLMIAYNAQVLRIQFERLIRLMQKIMEDLDEANDPDNHRLLRLIVERVILELTQQSDGYASLWLVKDNTLKRDYHFTNDPPEELDEIGEQGVLLNDLQQRDASPQKIGVVGMAFRYKKPMYALDVTNPPWQNNLLRRWKPLQSEIAVPILDAKRLDKPPRGVLNVESRRRFGFTMQDIETLQLLTKMIDVALRNREVYQELRKMQYELGGRMEQLLRDSF